RMRDRPGNASGGSGDGRTGLAGGGARRVAPDGSRTAPVLQSGGNRGLRQRPAVDRGRPERATRLLVELPRGPGRRHQRDVLRGAWFGGAEQREWFVLRL